MQGVSKNSWKCDYEENNVRWISNVCAKITLYFNSAFHELSEVPPFGSRGGWVVTSARLAAMCSLPTSQAAHSITGTAQPVGNPCHL